MVTVDVEGYAAEKQLRDFSKLPISEQKRIRAERKKKKKERLAILAKISEYESQLCDSCKGQPNTYKCDCAASKAIQELGKRLGGETVIGRPKSEPIDDFLHITPETFNLQVYEDMKDANISDRDIVALLGWHRNKLHQWKNEREIVNKPQKRNRKELNGLTVEAYKAHKKDKRTDNWILGEYNTSSATLWKWKKDNGLLDSVKPEQAVQQPKGEKMMNDVVKVENAPTDDIKVKYDTLLATYESLKEEHNDVLKTSAVLEVEILNLKSLLDSSNVDLQAELHSLTAENGRLKNYERDYRNLEVDYLNERTENERLKSMLDRLKHTAQINVWLMEQHVGFHKQLDEVMG